MTTRLGAGVSPSTAARFSAGDRGAFEEVYAAHAPQVRNWVRRFLASPFEREEAVQEVWLLVARNAHTYQVNRGPLAPWLRALTANRCRELMRSSAHVLEVPLEDTDDAGWLDSLPTPEASSALAQLRLALTTFAQTLSPEEAQVLQLGWIEGRTIERIAHELKCSPRQVKYLRLKVVKKAGDDETLRALLREVG